jgi:hypothetical protein
MILCKLLFESFGMYILHGKIIADAPLCFRSKYLGEKELRPSLQKYLQTVCLIFWIAIINIHKNLLPIRVYYHIYYN